MKKVYNKEQVAACFHGREPWFNVFFLKKISVGATRFLANYTSVSPNFITGLSLAFGLLSGWFYGADFAVYGALSYLASYICDAVDGKLARLTGRLSRYGAWLDIAVDRLVFFSVSVGLGWSQLPQNYSLLLTALLIFLFLFGFESRYNIQVDDLQRLVRIRDYETLEQWHPVKETNTDKRVSRWNQWLEKNGLVDSPFTLVEMLILLFVVAPVFDFYMECAVFSICILSVRILMQQKYWLKNK
jgi:hypothetical protein